MPGPPEDDKTRVEAAPRDEGDGLPRRIGRFHVLGSLGAGAQGRVLLGYDADLNRRVAIKLLRGSGGADERDRMRREAQALALLSHPNVVQVFEVGEYANTLYLAMEYVSGSTLHAWVKLHGPREILGAYLQAGRGLAAAHSAGLVHRDFKPLNAMVGKDGRVRVMDFGLARGELATRSPEENTVMRAPTAVLWSGVTEAGSLMGTPAYMAPEHWNGAVVDARTDQFAFCVSLWEGLYGERPYAGKTTEDFRAAILGNKRREPPAGAKVPSWLRQAIERGMQSEPAQRWPSMAALLAELESGTPRRRRRFAAAAVLGLGAVIAGEVGYTQVQGRWQAEACWDGGQELVTQWAAARPGVEAAFIAAAPALGERTFRRASAIVEVFTASWADAKSRLCMMPRIDPRWSSDLVGRAEECLLDARWAFDGTLERFAAIDADAVQHAVAAVSDLPPPTTCLDLSYLARQSPPPADEQVRAEVLRVRQALRQVRTLGVTGRFQEGLGQSRALIPEADAVGWRPLAALARFRAAMFASDVSDLKQAEAWLDEAMVLAAETGQDALLTDIVTGMADLVGGRMARHEEGIRWARLAQAMNVAQGEATTLRGTWALNILGLIYLDRGRLDEAEEVMEQILTIVSEQLGADALEMAGPLNNRGNLHYRRDRLEDARVCYQRALELFERILGPEHPDVALALGNLARLALDRGDLDKAERLGLRALAIREQTNGAESIEASHAQQDLGNIYRSRGESAKALELLERAAVGAAKALGAEHPEVGYALLSLGELHLQRGDLDKAARFYTRALGIFQTSRGPEDLDVAPALTGLGEVALARNRVGEAARQFERALELYAAHERPRDAAWARFALARTRWARKATQAEARALARAAAEELTGLDASADRAEIEAWLRGHGG
ncbi:serine/threonine-protein kinase [Nannocystis bainbridge]|uniref:Serine/threonine-protein kinase n=1 Tax=Nannocystis bainbridge TaxID=2995303 RepID=A0ABT5E423_9BACT|nr:serine/threonine-protein kinase [Nannocystis bainbridge]MDC0720610.1 serine/threonine-protein kinase [Nannocystis bainbridge]